MFSMTCDFIDEGQRCGKETEVDMSVYHPNHEKYTGEPESPYPLELCGEHKDEKITWKMIQENHEWLLEADRG